VRIAVILNMVAPYTTPVFERIAQRQDCDLLVVYETTMEPDRRWEPPADLPFDHVVLNSWTLDLSRLAVGTGVRTRFDTYLYIPRRPLDALGRFAPEAVVGAGGGIWSSPTNIVALAARRRGDWAFVPWWGSFERPRPTLPRRLAEPWVRAFIRAADAWMAYGTRSARDVVRLGADPARTVVAPLVARLPEQARSAGSAGRAHGDPLRYLFVGRLIERKGVDILLRAFRELERGELWIAGDGPIRSELEKAGASDQRVQFLGHLDDQALHELYSHADVLVIPSWYEPWGLVVNEALAHGIAVIATDQVGAADDLIDPATNGFIVPAGSSGDLVEAMRRIAAWTATDWERCTERSREKLESCTVERAADAIVGACLLARDYRRGRLRRAS
jgi:glycosyltransferase involved in cell wall biosynthesis